MKCWGRGGEVGAWWFRGVNWQNVSSYLLKDFLRVSDAISRLGGDEFLLILPNCTIEQAITLWERVQQNLELLNSSKQKPFLISSSVGFAEYKPGSEMSANKLMEIADNEMYFMKNAVKSDIS